MAAECVRVAEGGEVLERVTTSMNCFACMLGDDDRRTLYLVTAVDSNAADGAGGSQRCASRRCARPCRAPACRDAGGRRPGRRRHRVACRDGGRGRPRSPGRLRGVTAVAAAAPSLIGVWPDRRPAPRRRPPYLLAVGGSGSVGFQPTSAHPHGQPTDSGYADDLVPLGSSDAGPGSPSCTSAVRARRRPTMLDGGGHCPYPEGTQLRTRPRRSCAPTPRPCWSPSIWASTTCSPACATTSSMPPASTGRLATVHDQLGQILARHRGRGAAGVPSSSASATTTPTWATTVQGSGRPGLRGRQPRRHGPARRHPAGGLRDGRHADGRRRRGLRSRRPPPRCAARPGHRADRRRPDLRADLDVRPPAARPQPAPRRRGLPGDRGRHCRRRRRLLRQGGRRS